ncbi:MAG: hypothetical protein WC699_09230 [Bacteroidales bacterium]|jgi:hypothetical protein
MSKKNRFLNILQLSLLALLLWPGMQDLSAQNLSTSPYSRFGLGDLVNKSTGRSQAMGGLSCGLRSTTNLNLLNPASLGGIDTLSFVFEVAGFDKVTHFATTDLQKTVNNMGFSYLALGFPVTKWWKASLGILPLSNVGYSMTASESNPVMGTINYNFQGSGGISQFFISSAVSPFPFLSLGATFSYLFGPISHSRSLIIPADSLYFSTKSVQTAVIGDVNMSYGAQINIPFKNDFFLTLGGTFQGTTNLHALSRTTLISYGTAMTDTLLYSENPDNSVIMPMGWASGFTIGKKNKFTAGFDYRTQNWSESEFLGIKDSMANSHDYIVGLEFIPNINSLTRYSQRVRYRAGFRYSESYLQLKGSQLTELGITFGAGFPMLDRTRRPWRTQSTLNVIFELGKRGTVKNDLIRETFGSLTLQLSLHDYWFMKPKYD